MKWEIKNKELLLNNQVITGFVPTNDLKNRKYTLYAYADIDGDDLYIKFGEAKKQSVFSRYDITGHRANKQMVMVWESNKGDKIIHKALAKRSENKRGYTPADADVLNTTEAYKIESKKGYENLIKDITEFANSSIEIKKEERKDYPSIIKLCDEIIGYNEQFYNLDLCARWGKTGTALRLCKMYNEQEKVRMFFMCSYVATVKHSYSEEIATIANNDNCLFIDPDSYEDIKELKADIDSWLKDKDHYIMYYIALTGDSKCFSNRIKALNKFNKKSVMFIEEADFGAHCDNQISKIKKLFNKFDVKHVLSMTGSNADRCEAIFNF